MWIEQILIEHFGLCKDLSIRDLTPGLNVLVGPNEAGKSSVLEFIRSVFFGFRTKTQRLNTYEPPGGATRSGWLDVHISGDRRLRIQRSERRGSKEGVLSLWDESGKTLEPSILPLFKPGMDRNTFENLFAFDLDRMRHLDKQTLRGRVVSAALGTLDVNPLDVAKRLEEKLKRLGKRTKRDPDALYAIQCKIDDLNKRLHLLAQKPDLYALRCEDLDTVRAQRDGKTVEILDAERSLQRLSNIVRYEKEWQRLMIVQRELTELADVSEFPADGVSRLDRMLDRKREAEEALAQREKDLEYIRERLAKTRPDQAILAHADRIHALARESRNLSGRPSYLARERASIAQAYATLDQELNQLGTEWTRQRLIDSDPSLVLEQRVRSCADSCQWYREKIRDEDTRLFECTESLERLEQKSALKEEELHAIMPECRGFLEPEARDKLQEWNSCINRIEDLQERLEEKKRLVRNLVEQRKIQASRIKELEQDRVSVVPAGVFWPVLVVWGLSAAGMALTGYRGTDTAALAFLAIGVVMVVLLPFAIMWKVRNDRAQRGRISGELDALRRQMDDNIKETIHAETMRRELIRRMDQLKKRSLEIASAVLGNPSAGPQEVADAEHRSSQAEEPVRRAKLLEENLKELRTDMELERQRKTQIQRTLDVFRGEMEDVKQEWQTILQAQDFDQRLEPEPALEIIRRLRDLKSRERVVAEREETLASLQEEWNAFTEAAGSLASDLREQVTGVSPLDTVDRWTRSEMQSRESLTLQKELQERLRELLNESEALAGKVHAAIHEIHNLLNAAAVQDEEAFRMQAERHRRRESLEEESRVLMETLMSGLQCKDLDELISRMQGQDWDAHKATIGMLERRLQRLRSDSEDLAARTGSLEREIQTMETEEEAEQLSAEREEWLARLRSGIREWLTFRVARHLLEQTLDVYETQKQPKVLDRGSHFLRSIAGESFARILLPLDRDHVLVEREKGTRVQEEHLSRGTLEQVYLALRLAHIDVYHKGEMALPLMMDDVLVNFDPGRGRATAATLAEFSRQTGVQILFFTCHPGTVNLFPGHVSTIDMGAFPVGLSHAGLVSME